MDGPQLAPIAAMKEYRRYWAWLYWGFAAFYGGQTVIMSFWPLFAGYAALKRKEPLGPTAMCVAVVVLILAIANWG